MRARLINENVADCCPDWVPQIAKINGPIQLQSIRAGRNLYTGIPFRFCPWCGKAREQKAEKEINENK